ncbi:glycosyltransferase [Candidatus Pelagibacter sp.]|nr:glycosyltransferase [Candidatus Pelagibacter sp.]
MISKKVTIYIPAFNAENTIEKSIYSIFNQTNQFDEIIIVDDNSTDNTNKLVSKFKNIRLIKNSMNMGLSYCRNLAIYNSSNNLVASIDADVVLNKKWLEILLIKFAHNNNIMCGGKMIEKFTQNKFNAWRAKYYSQNWGDKSFDNPAFLFGCNTIQNKEIWEKVGGYDEKLISNGEDIDYANKIKLISKTKLIYCADALCEHLQMDNLESLSNRVWRYHSFGYKIKEISFMRLIKLAVKQLKFFLKRTFHDLINLRFNYIYINFIIFIKFIIFEFKNYLQKI